MPPATLSRELSFRGYTYNSEEKCTVVHIFTLEYNNIILILFEFYRSI